MTRHHSFLILSLGVATLAASIADAGSSRLEELRARMKARRAGQEASARATPVKAQEATPVVRKKGLTEAERQAAERRVRDMLRALESGDEVAFTRALAEDFSQNRSIVENAIREDEQAQSDVRIEIFLRQVRTDGDTITVQFDWNRQANDFRSGAPDGTKGTATFFLDRSSDMKVTRMQGPLPFGVRDRDLVEQAGGKRAHRITDSQPVKLRSGF